MDDTLFMFLNSYDIPICFKKYRYKHNIDNKLPKCQVNRTVIEIISSRNYIFYLKGYIINSVPNIKGYIYTNGICVIVCDEGVFDKVDLFEVTSSDSGGYFSYKHAGWGYGIMAGLGPIELIYFVKNNKLKKIYEHVEKNRRHRRFGSA